MKMTPEFSGIGIDQLEDELFVEKGISVSVYRLDKIHPVVSGNKLFKLHYFLEEADRTGCNTLLSFGGAYSNHLVATAFAGREAGFSTIGIVRGEKADPLSHTLKQCMDYGMRLHFVSRAAYSDNESNDFIEGLRMQFGDFLLIPEGGYHPLGAKGASLIRQGIDKGKYTHICLACGTATTLAGLLMEAEPNQKIIAVPVLKGMTDWESRLNFLLAERSDIQALEIWDDHHFGGYAKKNNSLIHFMNDCWQKYKLPLDFVYTAKMLYAVFEKALNNGLPPGSQVLCIHTGGLQGNGSLPGNTLFY